ncbi:hypothetical protein HPB49_006559 [Dermacentor silvarum]|uniref:Uncharacterized protein n=1 Tax=Dermacentor silvarum TaxID=543639 RepID=A0ACB8DVS5_DERSI|nr:hypothetical protein HPB49_006559 [Dermacentor silvarum]
MLLLVREELGLQVCKPEKGQLIQAGKASRLMKSRRMKELNRGGALNRILFNDEMSQFSPSNCLQKPRQLLPQASPRTTGISVLGKNKLIFVPKGVKIDVETCRELFLEIAVIQWAIENAENINWRLQQD